MKRAGSLLVAVGGLVGIGAAAWVALGVQRFGHSWLVAIGLVKLTVVASLGLMAAGAVLIRLANRSGDAQRRAELQAKGEAEEIRVAQRDTTLRGPDQGV